jgi:hypothetical protein
MTEKKPQPTREEWLMEQIGSQATLSALAAERHAVRRDQLWPSYEPMPDTLNGLPWMDLPKRITDRPDRHARLDEQHEVTKQDPTKGNRS